MPYAQRDGLQLYYEQEGTGEPELLFVHGWCCDHTFYGPQVDHFKASHRVTTVDLRGCGESSKPDHGYDIPTLADDIAWLCDQAGITSPIVVGHSLGGMIVIELAARYPKLPRAVVADDPGPIDPTPRTVSIFEAFADELDGPDGENVRRAWVEDGAGPSADEKLSRWIVETMCAVPLPIAASVIRNLLDWNGVGALGLCEVPLLILSSGPYESNDPIRLSQIKPDACFGMTVGAGHFHQLETPGQVTAMIERFLEVALADAGR